MAPRVLHKNNEEIIALRKRGISIRDIARMTGVPKTVVHRILNKERACDK